MPAMAVVVAIVAVVMVVIVVVVARLVVVRRYRSADASASGRADDRTFPAAELLTYRSANGAADAATDRCVDRLVSERCGCAEGERGAANKAADGYRGKSHCTAPWA
jgi:hypothetical protein